MPLVCCRRPKPPRPRPTPRPAYRTPLLSTRQLAVAFNQPLSFDTSSSVTTMSYMFSVRSAHALDPPAFTAGPSRCACRSCAAAGPRAPASQPTPRPASHAPLFDLTGRVGVQPAAELRHVQRHEHAAYVRGALHACLSSPSLQSDPHPMHAARALPPAHAPPPPGPHLAAHRTPFFSTRQSARAFNQPLSFDTSSVTTMHRMFTVRSAHALDPPTFTAGPSPRACRSCAAAGPSPPASRPTPRPAYRTPSF